MRTFQTLSAGKTEQPGTPGRVGAAPGGGGTGWLPASSGFVPAGHLPAVRIAVAVGVRPARMRAAGLLRPVGQAVLVRVLAIVAQPVLVGVLDLGLRAGDELEAGPERVLVGVLACRRGSRPGRCRRAGSHPGQVLLAVRQGVLVRVLGAVGDAVACPCPPWSGWSSSSRAPTSSGGRPRPDPWRPLRPCRQSANDADPDQGDEQRAADPRRRGRRCMRPMVAPRRNPRDPPTGPIRRARWSGSGWHHAGRELSPGTPPVRAPRAHGPRRGRPRPAATSSGTEDPPARPPPA